MDFSSSRSSAMARRLILVCAMVLAGVFAFVVQAVTPATEAAMQATFTVNSVGDAVDAAPGNGTCATATGVCTLRAAIQEANASAGDDIIDLRAGTYVFSLAGASEEAAATGDLDITESLQVLGAGETSTIIDADKLDRIFHVIGNINVTISGVTIRNGLTPAGLDGGGVLADDNATLFLSDSIVQGNQATHWGGGLHSDSGAATTITDVTFRDNIAGELGGAVDNYDGNVIIRNSRILNNSVTSGPGGGVYNGAGGVTTIEDTTIDGNQASTDGGGVYNFRPDSATTGSLDIRRTAITNNQATLNGAGLFNFGLLQVLQNTTISGNNASDRGGGLYNLKSITLVNHVTIYNNSSANQGGGIYNDVDSTMTIQNSIVASNSNDNCKPINPITSGGYNIEGTNSCGFNATGDDINTDPLLGPLQDHGGPSFTHKPAANSPAIDNASVTGPPGTDQRGVVRPQGDGYDIGAHEHQMADLSITKSDDPDPVYAGQVLTYTLTVANAGQSDAITVKVTDTLPANTTFVSVSASGWSCSHVSGVLLCNKTILRSGQSSTITFLVTAPAEGGAITNSASVGSTITDLKTADNRVSQTTTVTAVADLSITKNDDVDPVNAAAALEYSLQVANAGPSTATNVVVTDTLMAGVTYVSAVGAGWSCAYDTASHVVTCTRASLSVGSAPVITIDVTAPDEDGPVYNVAQVTSSVVDLDSSNNQADEYTTVTAVADLSVTKSDVADPVYAREALTYTLRVENVGPSTAQSVVLTDTLPAGVTFVSATGTGWTCDYDSNSHTVKCTRASFAVGPAQTIQILVTAPTEGGTINNSVSISSDALDLSTANNSDTEATVITPKSDLSITQSHSPESVYAEGTLTYKVLVHNDGPSTATSLVVSSTLPSDVTILSASGAGWTCTPNQANHLVTCTRSSLGTGDAPEITITVQAPAEGGTTVNHSRISAATFDPDMSNNLATEDATVIPVADLQITLADSPDPVEASERLTYTLTVLNNGPSRASGVMVTDTLPSSVSFVSGTGTKWSCNNNDNFNVVSCSLSDDLPAGSSTTIEVVVTVPSQAGTITNEVMVGSPITDFNMNNNRDEEMTVVGAVAGLSINVTGMPNPVDATENVTYTVSVYNHGPSEATSVKVTDELPDDLTFVSAEGSGWSCSYIGATHDVECTRAALSTGLAPSITIIGTSPSEGGAISNLAKVTAVTPDPDLVNDNADSVEIDVRPVADLSITLSDNLDPVDANTSLTYQAVVNNGGPSTATALEVEFELPVGTTYNNASGSGWSCTYDDRATVTCTRANLAPSTSGTIDFVLMSPAEGGSITASAAVSSATLDKNPSNNSSSESTTVTPVADLAITMGEFPTPVDASSVVTIILTATNLGPSTAESLLVVDTLSPNVDYVDYSGEGWTCGYNSATHKLNCERASLAVGAAPNILINVQAPNEPIELDNSAHISAATKDLNSTNDIATTDILVDGQVDLSITIEDSPDPVDAATHLGYTLRTANAGPSTAQTVVVTASVPVSATNVMASGLGWTCGHDSGVVTCLMSMMGVGNASDITISLDSPPDGGTAMLSASIGSVTEETNPSNNRDSEETSVVPMANLAVSKRDHPDPVYALHPLTYTLSVSNSGPSRVDVVQVIDTLAPEAAFVEASGEGWACVYEPNAHEVTCTRPGGFPVGVAPEILIVLTAPAEGGFLDNTVRVSSPVSDFDISDNADTEGTDVTPVAGLSLSVTDVPDPVYVGQTLYYNLRVDNAGPSVAELVTVTQQLPAQVVFEQVIADDWNCTYNQFDHAVSCFMTDLRLGAAEHIDVVVTIPTSDMVISSTTSVRASTVDLALADNTVLEETMVTSGSDLSISVMSHPEPLGAGQPMTHYLRVDNAGPGEARDVQATVILHEQVIFNACPGATCTHNNGIVTYQLPDMEVGHTEYLTLTVTPRTNDGVMIVASVSTVMPEVNLDDNETEMGINFQHLYIPLIGKPAAPGVDLSIRIKDSADPVRADNTLFYTLEVGNAGRHSAEVVIVTATLPDEAKFITVDGGSDWTCLHEDGIVTCTERDLRTGPASDIVLALMPPPDAGTTSFTATIRSDTEDGDLDDNSATEETVVVPIADVAVTQSDSVDPVYAAHTLNYTLNVVNNGPSLAQQVQVVDTLPPEVSFVSATGAGWACEYHAVNSTVICTRPSTLAAGSSSSILIAVTAPAEGTHLDNVVRVSSTVTDPNLLNNLDTEQTDVTPVADLSLTVTDDPSQEVDAGDPLRYTIRVNNGGASTASLVNVTYDLPSNADFEEVTADNWSCTYQSRDSLITCSLATLAVGAAPPINVVVRPSNEEGVIRGTFTVQSNTLDLVPANNSASEETNVDR